MNIDTHHKTSQHKDRIIIHEALKCYYAEINSQLSKAKENTPERLELATRSAETLLKLREYQKRIERAVK